MLARLLFFERRELCSLLPLALRLLVVAGELGHLPNSSSVPNVFGTVGAFFVPHRSA